MQFELRAIQRKVGTTTIMVTHDQAEALSISDRVVVMEAGRVTQVDAPHRLYEQPANRVHLDLRRQDEPAARARVSAAGARRRRGSARGPALEVDDTGDFVRRRRRADQPCAPRRSVLPRAVHGAARRHGRRALLPGQPMAVSRGDAGRRTDGASARTTAATRSRKARAPAWTGRAHCTRLLPRSPTDRRAICAQEPVASTR